MPQTLEEAIEEGFRRGMEDAYIFAGIKSSGTKTYQDLTDEDHPYAKRHGAPLSDPSTINAHTGEFRDAWEPPQVMAFGGDLSGRIVNNSPVADFLNDGTVHMFRRPIGDEVELYAEKAVQVQVNRAVNAWAASQKI